LDGDNVPDSNSQIVADNAVHADLLVSASVVGQNHANGFFPLFAANDDRVGTEELKFVHFPLRECDYGVVIVDGLFDDESVGLALCFEDRRGEIILGLFWVCWFCHSCY
jgi:hypothetical protein